MIGRGASFDDIPPNGGSALASNSIGDGRSLIDPQSRWRNDSGAADPNLLQALATGDISRVVDLLAQTRVLIPLAESEIDSGKVEKSSDMAIVCLTATDGRIGLLAFTSVNSLTDWNSQARPIPILGKDAAIAALDEGASAILIDIAGANPVTITLPDLVRLTGLDQRHRVAPLLLELCDQFGVAEPVIEIPESGPIYVGVPGIGVEAISEALGHRSDIHAFVPEGIAVVPVEEI